MKNRFFIYSEKYEKTVIRHRSKRTIFNAVCEKCGGQVEWLTLEEVSNATGKPVEQIRRDVANGEFDFRITENDQLLVCGNSILETDL